MQLLKHQARSNIQNSKAAKTLRDYQIKLKNGVYRKIHEGHKRILVVSPTGSGKTLTTASIAADAVSRNKRVMWLCHRDFLIESAIETLTKDVKIDSGDIGVIKAGYSENYDTLVQVCSIQTLTNRKLPNHIDVLLVDEAHTTCFFSFYKKIISTYSDAIQIGLTATPWRMKSSKEYFGMFFEVFVEGLSISELTYRQFLVPARYFGWGGLVDMSSVDISSSGEFILGQMQDAFLGSDIPEIVAKKLQKLCKGKTGIIFNTGVKQSLIQVEVLNNTGIKTVHLDGQTPFEIRKKYFRQLENKEIDCISSIGCLTEGFDVRSLEYIILARSTNSVSLYRQMCGRGLRISPETGKQECIILDFGGNVKKHGYLTAKRCITLDPTKISSLKETLKECPECSSLLYPFARICPTCGYEFGSEEDEEEEIDSPLQFGELLDDESYAIYKYIRAQRRRAYTQKTNPDKIWDNAVKRYPKKIINQQWFFKCLFNGRNTEANRQKLLDWLEKFAPKTKYRDTWIRHHFDLEFGNPRKKYKFLEGDVEQEFQPEYQEIKRIDCWIFLGIQPTKDIKEVKSAYRKLCRIFHPDVSDLPENEAKEKMQLLNWAYDKVLELIEKIKS